VAEFLLRQTGTLTCLLQPLAQPPLVHGHILPANRGNTKQEIVLNGYTGMSVMNPGEF
jgi:hypothetical protein